MPDLDIVGGAAVDVVPIIPNFNTKLRALVLPIADKVGEEAGRRMGEEISRNIVVSIPSAINQGGNAARVAATRQGENTGGAFARSLRTKLEVAFRAMPKLDIRLGDTGVDAELARIRAQMEALSKKRIGVDVDVAAADAEVKRLDAELKRLGASHPNIAVRADTATARAALAEIRAEIAMVDGKTARIDVDASGAQGAVMNLGIQIAALTAIPAGPVLAAGFGALVSMLTAAATGVGAFAAAAIPAIKGVTEVLGLQKQAQQESTRATDDSIRRMVQSQQRAIQLAAAQQSLAAAHRNASRSIAQASSQVEAAERAVAQASERAADQRRQSAEAVRRAEQSLADAKRAALAAERDLTQAREDAARQLRELSDRLTDGQLSQREATLRVQEAQQELQAVMADPKATDLQRQRAQLSLDQARQSAKEQKRDLEDLQKEAEKQRKAGVDGNDAVKAAAERVSEAQRSVGEQTRAVTDAQRQAARAQRDALQSVVDAQRSVADATASAADAQVKAAEQIEAAERGVESARLSSIDTTSNAVTKQDEFRRKLAELTPAQRDLYDSIAGPRGLKKAFKEWQTSLQPAVLPIFTRAVDGLKNSLPGLTPFVEGAARAIGTLMDKASQELKSPFWEGFKKDLAENIEPAIVGFGVAFGNILKGMAGVVDAFLPHMDGIADRSDRITERFARWGTSLKGSPDFEKFLAYVKDTAPGLGEFLGDLLGAMVDVAQAASPLSQIMFAVLSPLLDGISWLAQNAPEVIQVLWGMYFATKAISLGLLLISGIATVYEAAMAVMSLATIGWTATLEATGIVPIIQGIMLVIGLLVLAVLLAWNHFEWFRDAVKGAWEGIKTAVSFAWYNVLSPIFTAIWGALKWVGDKAVWLWENCFQPTFYFITEAGKILVTALTTLIIAPIYLAIQGLGLLATWLWTDGFKPTLDSIDGAFKFLWEKIISPVCGWIGEKVTWLYDKAIRPAFRNSKAVVDDLGDKVSWLWREAVKPVFNWIGEKASWLYDKAIKPPFELVKKAVGKVAEAFEKAKDDIETAWNLVSDIVMTPVKVIVDVVYTNGIRPVWNAVAGVVGADELPPVKLDGYHTGGVIPGYTPGVDNQLIAVGGGEAIMRPEWTRAMGADYVHNMNAAARNGGVAGVQRMINAGTPAFADGGIVGWIKHRVKDVGDFFKTGWNAVTNPAKIFNAAKDWVLSKVKGFADNQWARAMAKMPISMLKNLKDKVVGWFKSNGNVEGNVLRALTWARTQAGKPYQWGGGGNPSWDCSGFMSGIQKVIEGRNPKGRLWSTHDFSGNKAPKGWVKNLPTPFMIGVTNAGVGHTAGTLAGTNVESRGGDGVLVGPKARGARHRMFTDVYGFRPSLAAGGGMSSVESSKHIAKQMMGEFGFSQKHWSPLQKLWTKESGWRWDARNDASGAYGIPQSLPASKMKSAGSDWLTNPATQIKWGLGYIKDRYRDPTRAWSWWQSHRWYDDGGYLPPGLSLVANGTGKPEPVFTSGQWDTLRASAGNGRGTPNIVVENHTYIGDTELTDIVDHRYTVREAETSRAIEAGRW
ncbi:hypothetical protein [Streptomyces sparsogenes]|uniref:Uncharacterized protein n=1 Tax=Streptomyces sparsogenes DSM 40356 TaxID=1331668 RepID=A0A1R1STD9_9ACTN|nr:hypothetical protein [Streptomyces sparsogenes]OMI41564.1 hypothetical protein SPAR_00205 [Streptomyces sparsogenes DSM 40356]